MQTFATTQITDVYMQLMTRSIDGSGANWTTGISYCSFCDHPQPPAACSPSQAMEPQKILNHFVIFMCAIIVIAMTDWSNMHEDMRQTYLCRSGTNAISAFQRTMQSRTNDRHVTYTSISTKNHHQNVFKELQDTKRTPNKPPRMRPTRGKMLG